MKLGPKDHATILEMVATQISREIILGCGGQMADLVLLPLAVAEKMMGLDSRTIRARIPVVEVGPKKLRVKLSDVQDFIDARTRQPERGAA
jgi:hypothetical protein